MSKYRLGTDIGSTTVKLVIIDEDNNLVFGKYQRHYSDIGGTLTSMLKTAMEEMGDIAVSAMISGSGGLSLANWIGIDFIQEVVAVTAAIDATGTNPDVAIEIGGEDAKIIYLTGGVEQRMNGICAGGTGSFIDQMAALLQTDATGLNELSKNFANIYPIAARCGVFAKSDIQPLINDGVKREDLAVSIFQAIVNQTIGGLACGRPIRGKVLFLGGPLHFLPELRKRFIDVLHLKEEDALETDNSHFFAALGAALNAKKGFSLSDILHNLGQNKVVDFEINRLNPLFKNEADYTEFRQRHDSNKVRRRDLATYKGDAFLGIDAGSTTTKMVLINPEGELLYSFYGSNKGAPVDVVKGALLKLFEDLPEGVEIKKSCATGYGETLIRSAFKIDLGEIETMAHYKAAAFFDPKVDFILDIGGQDMKCIRINDGVIEDVVLNEACSAGCGSFIETFATSLNYSIEDFAKGALFAKNPIDLGSRCTVFMNSRVKQAQKEGAQVIDISSGLSYSVIKNALQKVIKIHDVSEIGDHVVVQGGTFYNESVLRAFELIGQTHAIRPDIAGLMGAFGAAIIAKDRHIEGTSTALISIDNIKKFKITTSQFRCQKCHNACLMTVNHFTDGSKHTTGNRCELGLGIKKTDNELPNLFEYKYNRLFSYKPLEEKDAKRGTVGIPRVLNIYENYPFWFTFFTELGYRVELSPQSNRDVFQLGIESIPSESVCYPAKMVHGHVMALIQAGIKFIFYPSVVREKTQVENAEDTFNCPIVISYSENIKNNMEEIKDIEYHKPFLRMDDIQVLTKGLVEEFAHIPKQEVTKAVNNAWQEQENFDQHIRDKGYETLALIKKTGKKGIVLAGRPYHLDPEINHGIDRLIHSFGAAVLTEDSIYHLGKKDAPLGVRDQWAYQSRLYASSFLVKDEPLLELVQLTSFGCGIDSITTDEVHDILARGQKIYTLIKIDEVSNLGSAKIRIRTLFAALEERKHKIPKKQVINKTKRVAFTKEMRKTHTILCPQMAPIQFEIIQEAFKASGYNMVILPAMDKEAIDEGLKYVNNDTCYPAIISVGQLVKAIKSGEYDTDNVSVLMSQTGGGCRASNYIYLIRKALAKAGYGHIPVISISARGIEKNPGFKITPGLINRALQALVYGDLLMRLLYRVRPYEKNPGETNQLYNKWVNICKESVKTASRHEYKTNIYKMVEEFDTLEILDIKKPKVGVVGEILVKFHPTANNDIFTFLEEEGVEIVIPDLMDFLLYGMHNYVFNVSHLGAKKTATFVATTSIKALELYRKHIRTALENSKRFKPPAKIEEIAHLAEPIISIGNQTGEGWFLTGEMAKLLKDGVDNIVCLQPFGCMPNHITGKGVIKELKQRYPMANIVAIDYDPGASEVNQINRIKLMLATSFKNM